jgi:hypothetical protein
MEGLYQCIVPLHVIAAFTFALAHGVSGGVALKLRGERKIPRVQALLDLSQFATNGMYVSVVTLLIAGVTAAFIAGLWGRGWIWAAIVLLVVMFAAMYAALRPGSATCAARRSAVRAGKGRAVGGTA